MRRIFWRAMLPHGPCSRMAPQNVPDGNGRGFRIVHTKRQEHRTPRRRGSAALQIPFWYRLRRVGNLSGFAERFPGMARSHPNTSFCKFLKL